MKKLWNMFVEWIRKDNPKPNPDRPTPDLIHVAKGNVLWRNLKESCLISSGVLTSSGFKASYSGNDGWYSKDGHTCGWVCMTWMFNGKPQAEYWDGMSKASPYMYVSLFHITDPTSPFNGRLPKKGQDVGMFFVSEAMTQRSDIAWCKWPL